MFEVSYLMLAGAVAFGLVSGSLAGAFGYRDHFISVEEDSWSEGYQAGLHDRRTAERMQLVKSPISGTASGLETGKAVSASSNG